MIATDTELKAMQERITYFQGLLAQFRTTATPEEYKRGAERMASYWDEWAKAKGAETQEALKKVREALGR